MGIGEVFIIGVSLAMDAFSVSVSDGVCLRRLRPRWLFGIAGVFGLFQGLMPLAGYLAGASFAWLVTRFSRPIVCAVLCVIGLKMLWDAGKGEDSGGCFTLSKKTVLVQAVATSMDALAVGVGFSTMQLPIPATCGLIALTTFLICFAGVAVGHRFGCVFRRQAVFLGGLVLIAIGIKILLDV